MTVEPITTCIVVVAVLALPYAYILARIVSWAYFSAKLDYHSRLFQHLEKEVPHGER